MKSIAATSIILLTSVVPSLHAWAVVSNPDTFLGGVQFPCGDDAENWVIDVGFGTPEQKEPLLIDTTSNTTFVSGILCQTDFCMAHKRFDAGKSTTIKDVRETETLIYEDGTAEVHLYSDTIDLGGIKFDNYIFGKAFNTTGFEPSDFAGSFSLGVPESYFPKKIDKRDARDDNPGNGESAEVSVSVYPIGAWFGNKRKRNNNGLQCVLNFGIDPNVQATKISWLDIPTCDFGDSPFWKTELTCAIIDSVVDLKFEKKTLASFDTTTKDIEIPNDDLNKIYEALDAKLSDDDNVYEFKCCNANDFTFTFDKTQVTISKDSWTVPKEGKSEYCTARLSESDDDNWHLGYTFFLNFQTIFSVERAQIGLSLVKGGSVGASISSS